MLDGGWADEPDLSSLAGSGRSASGQTTTESGRSIRPRNMIYLMFSIFPNIFQCPSSPIKKATILGQPKSGTKT